MQKKDLSKLVLTTLLNGSVLWGGTAFAAEENLQEFSWTPWLLPQPERQ